jgi:benzoyl-CoA reductase subunit C
MFEELITDVTFAPVRRWKEEAPHRRAVAYFPVYAPVEIFDALGMLPVGISGAGDQLDIQHADARFGSFICSIAKTTMELGLTNHLDLFDAIYFSGICDTARNLCWVLKRNLPDVACDFLHLPQNCTSAASVDFLESEYRRVVADMEKLTGRTLSRESLRQSIDLYNENRSLTRKLYALRSRAPENLATRELYAAVRAGNFMPVDEHNAALRNLLNEVGRRHRKRRDSIRIVIEGSFCEQPPLDLINIIEQAGCYIVEDDFTLGRRWFTADVHTAGDLVRALAEAYVNESTYSSVRHDSRKPRPEELIRKVHDHSAYAVLLLVAKFCEPAYFDYVLFRCELERASIPHLLLEFEEKMFTFDRIRTEIETFVESLLFA